jgi:DNA processing protein
LPSSPKDPSGKNPSPEDQQSEHQFANEAGEVRGLDPADAGRRSLLCDWLTFQRSMALRPQVAVRAFREQGHPRRALRAALRQVRSTGSSRASGRDSGEGAGDRNRLGGSRNAELDADLAALARAQAVALPVDSPLYPERLAALSDPALLLLVRGRPELLSRPSVAIVGSRAATVYGKRVARQIGAELASAGITVVSGLARGIDAEAHEGALDAGGVTVAVLACGIDRVYPSEHRSLARRVAASGAVISELPLGTQPRPAFFPMRNRLISGLSLAVVVVEARERSGTLITASHAANQGRDVFAVPGPITSPTSEGANRLLRDGAYVALSADDVLRELGVEPVGANRIAQPGRPLGDSAAGVLAALRDAPASRDELGRRLGRAPEQLALDLLELELDGRVAEDRDGRMLVVDLPE